MASAASAYGMDPRSVATSGVTLPDGMNSSVKQRIGARGKYFDMVNYYDNSTTGNIDTLYIDGMTFFQACHKGAVTTVMAFLMGGMDPNTLDVDGAGFAGLHYAVSGDDAQLAAILIDAGGKANLVSASSGGMTPLMVALDVGAFDCVQLLLNRGASLEETNQAGDPAIFYAANQPFLLHVIANFLKVDLKSITNQKGETLLHKVCEKRHAEHRWDVFYLIEQAGIDVNVTDAEGETALFVAVRTQEYEHVAALIAKGAEVRNAVNKNGEDVLSLPIKNAQIKRLLKDASEANNSAPAIEKLVAEDFSNVSLLFRKESLIHVAVPLIVPNTLIVLASFLPSVFGLLVLGLTGFGFMKVAQFALKQKNRSLPTAGWFCGALFYGSGVLIVKVFPIFEKHNEHNGFGFILTSIWYVVTIIMFCCYVTAVLRDPGVVRSSVEGRQEIYNFVAKQGKAALETENIDTSSMVKKPFRSKHCSKTHRTVSRFDHYCVWTGNAIGGGNHRAFVWYCICQLFSQLIVVYVTFSVVFNYAPADHDAHFGSPCALFDWLLGEEMTLITYFLVVYNTALLLFVSMILMTQIWYVTRNVTSNEVWFANRYKWMFNLGSRAYSFYDQGFFKNIQEFVWTADLCRVSYTMPPMNDHLRSISRAYAQKMKAMQQKSLDANESEMGEKDDGMMSSSSDAPTSIVSSTNTAATTGETAAATSSSSSSSAVATTTGTLPPQESPTAVLQGAMQQATPQVRNQMQVLQHLLGQMIKGNSDPDFPADTEYSAEEKAKMLEKARMMHSQYSTMISRKK